MKCPTCGALEERHETVCSQCGATYTSEDLLAFRQLEFLLAETDGWVERLPADLIEELRQPYVKQLTDLRARLIPAPTPPPPAVEEVAVPAEVGVAVHALAFVTAIKADGEKSENLAMPVRYASPNYATASSRVRLDTLSFVGEISVRQG